MSTVRVTHVGADRYKVETRGHVVLTDQERADTIEIGPTPTELLVMSIACSAARRAVRYVRARGFTHEDLRVDCTWTMEGDPPHVGKVDLTFTPSIWLTSADHADMLAAVRGGTVLNSPRNPPTIEIVALSVLTDE